eukprot:Tbor_TRINITY_DN5325_c3_g8::TRINITY_DN5325_c3_g8_i1::g.5031::m.5031
MSSLKFTPEFTAIQEIITLKNRKEDVPEELYKQAGISPEMRLKDIQKKAQQYKAISGSQATKQQELREKQEALEEKNEQIAAEAQALGISVQQYMESKHFSKPKIKSEKDCKREKEAGRKQKDKMNTIE